MVRHGVRVITTRESGRVLKNMPAPTNLEIPPHRYLTEARLLIGEDKSTT
jgi:hypothetical protein